MNVTHPAVGGADEELISRSLAGDSTAFRDLYRKCEKKVRQTMRNLCGDTALDDHVQEVFVRVWRHLKSFRNDSSFSTWLFRIAHNVAMDCRRAHATERTKLAEIATNEHFFGEKQQENQDCRELIKKMLEFLDFDHRRVLVFVDLEEFSLQEVADILEIPLGTVKSRLHYARAQARVFLKKQGWKP